MGVPVDRPDTQAGTMDCVWAELFAQAGTFEIVALVDMLDHHRPAMVAVLDDTDDFDRAMVWSREASVPNTAQCLADVAAHDTCGRLVPADTFAFGTDALGVFVDSVSPVVRALALTMVDPLQRPHAALYNKKKRVN